MYGICSEAFLNPHQKLSAEGKLNVMETLFQETPLVQTNYDPIPRFKGNDTTTLCKQSRSWLVSCRDTDYPRYTIPNFI